MSRPSGFNPRPMTQINNFPPSGPQKPFPHTPTLFQPPPANMNPQPPPMTPGFQRMPLGPPPMGMRPPVPQPPMGQKVPVVNGNMTPAQSNGLNSNSSSRQESPVPMMMKTSSQQSINSIGSSTVSDKLTPLPPNNRNPSPQIPLNSIQPSGTPSSVPSQDLRQSGPVPNINDLRTPVSQPSTGQIFRYTPGSTGQNLKPPTPGSTISPMAPTMTAGAPSPASVTPQSSSSMPFQPVRPFVSPMSRPMHPIPLQSTTSPVSNPGISNQRPVPPLVQNNIPPPGPAIPPTSFGGPPTRPPMGPMTPGVNRPTMKPGSSYPRPVPPSQNYPPVMSGVPSSPFNSGAQGPPQGFGQPPMGPAPSRPPSMASTNFQRPPTSPYMPPSTGNNQTVTSQPSSGQSFNANHYMAQPSKPNFQQVSQQFSKMSVTQDGWNKGWGTTPVDLMQQRMVLPSEGFTPPKPVLMGDNVQNCSSDIFRCTLSRIPETSSVLQKSRMPFGILIHPYKDLEHLPVVNCSLIVRCRTCRTYINPFITFKSERRWECNLCFKVNELPEEFQYDPLTRTYGDPSRRPEVREATIEFIAPAEYMLRPPQPAAYIYVLDVSRQAVDTGYLHMVCRSILEHLDSIPGDKRTLMAFITYSKTLQFYLLGEDQNSPCMLEVGSIEEVFLPCPQDLLVNVGDCRPLIEEFLSTLPETHSNTPYTESCLGAALQAAYKLLAPIGGRITAMVNTLPTLGPGALKPREDPNQRSAKEISHLGPATDFYKKFALDCSGQQIAVDLFTVNSQYVDLASLSGISKFSGGCIHHFPNFSVKNSVCVQNFKSCFNRYLTRKLGLEAVMRIRATRGLAITNFHGNFFVRSTDLLSLPNINPDAGFGMQVTVEESLHNIRYACFQAALLYTSSKGERRIRVHTMCLPVTGNVHEVITSVDQQTMIGFLAKLAVDRCLTSQMSDAREAVINACCDALSAFKNSQSTMASGLPAPHTLKLLPLYCLALLKSVALRHGVCTKLDDRVFAMCEMKTMPLGQLMLMLYPDLFPVHDLNAHGALTEEDLVIPQPGRMHLSAEFLDRSGAYLMDAGTVILVYVRSFVDPSWINDVIGVPNYAAIPQPLNEDPLPPLDNPRSEMLRNFVAYRQRMKAYHVPIWVLKEDNPERLPFIQRLMDDRSEGSHSYVEFMQYIRSQIK